MIYHYHFDFRDEKSLQTKHQKGHRGIIPVIEDSLMQVFEIFQLTSPWVPASGVEIRYFTHLAFSKEDHDQSWAMEIKNVLTLFWSKETNEILYRKGQEYHPDRLQFWLYHTFIPIMLELRGIYHIFHVGSVEIDGKSILFSAPSFGGKSTMTDYFINRGHTMFSDDSLGVEKVGDEYLAISSYPFHRPYRKFEDLGYLVEKFSTEVKPIHAVFVLNKSNETSLISIQEINGIEKFKAFHYSSFVMYDYMKQERFEFFTQMARKIPMYEVIYPHGIEKLDKVYEAIVTHSHKI